MSNLKLSGGKSTNNSITFFLKGIDNGVEAIRQEDGSITTQEVSSTKMTKQQFNLLKIIFVCSLFREFVFLLNLPKWLYHLPTIFFSLIFVIAIIGMLVDGETRMFHGAEHKVANWFAKSDESCDIESIKKCHRIHLLCGTNLLATIVTFQLASSICMSYFNIHIPEIITALLPLYVYTIFPFNLLGLIAQILTTAEPEEQHLTVALSALADLIKKN